MGGPTPQVAAASRVVLAGPAGLSVPGCSCEAPPEAGPLGPLHFRLGPTHSWEVSQVRGRQRQGHSRARGDEVGVNSPTLHPAAGRRAGHLSPELAYLLINKGMRSFPKAACTQGSDMQDYERVKVLIPR